MSCDVGVRVPSPAHKKGVSKETPFFVFHLIQKKEQSFSLRSLSKTKNVDYNIAATLRISDSRAIKRLSLRAACILYLVCILVSISASTHDASFKVSILRLYRTPSRSLRMVFSDTLYFSHMNNFYEISISILIRNRAYGR